MLFAPLMSNGAAIGMISVTRQDPGAFAPNDEQLLRTFADQAVIAIQNVRLFNETQEALERQTGDGRGAEGHRQFAIGHAAGFGRSRRARTGCSAASRRR